MDIQAALHDYIVTHGLQGKVPAGFNDDYDLIDSGIIDSLFMLNLVTYLEQQHQVEFGMNDLVPKHFKSIRALAAFVTSKTL